MEFRKRKKKTNEKRIEKLEKKERKKRGNCKVIRLFSSFALQLFAAL